MQSADIVTGGADLPETWLTNVLAQFQHRDFTPAVPSGGDVQKPTSQRDSNMQRHSDQYLQYLKSPEWNERRQARLQKANYRCERCGERDRLDVHHKTYEHLGNEPLSDLIALCQSCHWAADEERRGNEKPKKKLEEKPKKSKYETRTEEYEQQQEKIKQIHQKHLEKKYNHPIDMRTIE